MKLRRAFFASNADENCEAVRRLYAWAYGKPGFDWRRLPGGFVLQVMM